MAIEKLYLGVTTGDKKGDGAKTAGAKINAAFDYLENKIDSKDRVLVSTGFTQVGSVMTINAGWQWMINGITYTNPVAVEITFPLAEMDLERIDNVVATTSNTFMRIPGVEAVTPIAPLYQSGTVIISFSVINDAEIAEPDTPINNTDYVLKSEQYYTPVNSSGVLLKVGKKSAGTGINFLNAATVVGSLEVKPTYFNRLFDGVIYSIKNSQSIDIVFNHLDGTGNVLFSFPTATNFTLKPNEIFQCKLRITSWNTAVFDYIGVAGSAGGVGLPIAITDVTGLTAELDSKLDAADYNQHFKGVYLTEAALITAHPTASVGDYAQVNEVGASDVVNYNWDAEEGIWVKNITEGGSGATNTDELPEGTTNLYFTVARFLANLTYANIVTALGFTPENSSNKSQDIETDKTSTAKFGSVKAFYDWAVAKFQAVLVSGTNIKTLNGNTLLGSGDLAINAGLPFNPTVITTATYTFELTDSNTIRIFSFSTTTVTLTIPTDASVNFAIGTKIGGFFTGAVQLALSGAGVTIRNNSNTYPNNFFYIVKVSANVWAVESIDKTSPLFSGEIKSGGFRVNSNGQGYSFLTGSSMTDSGGQIIFNTYGNGVGGNSLYKFNAIYPHSQSPNASTGATSIIFDLSHIHNANGGNVGVKTLNFSPTINQIGGASGIIRSIYINPILTSAYDYRAIDISAGSIVFPYLSKSATYQISQNDYLLDFTSGTFIATLPTAVGCVGKNYVLKNSGSGAITIATTASQSIDGATTYSLAVQYSSITIVSNGANWIIIAKI